MDNCVHEMQPRFDERRFFYKLNDRTVRRWSKSYLGDICVNCGFYVIRTNPIILDLNDQVFDPEAEIM